jgi:hypothetical protein
MRILDTLINGNFTKLVDGRWVFYPWGSLFSGYILQNENDHESARIFLKRNYLLLLCVGIMVWGLTSIIATNWYWHITILSILLIYFVYSKKVKNFTESMDKFTEVTK